MKGKIIKINANEILVRPCENFLDVIIDVGNYIDRYTNGLHVNQEVDIKFAGTVIIKVNGVRFYGKFIDEDK